MSRIISSETPGFFLPKPYNKLINHISLLYGFFLPKPYNKLMWLISGEEFDQATAIAARKEEAKKIRRKKKRTASSSSLASNTFQVDLN